MKIAVVGGGIVGLSTALELHREFRNSEISILAASFDKNVSQMATGLFRISNTYSGPTEAITRNWIRDSYEYWDAIRTSSESMVAGVTQISGYFFANDNPRAVQNRWLPGIIPVYRTVTSDELESFESTWNYGAFMTTLFMQSDTYLSWAKSKLSRAGVNLIERKVDSLKSLTDEFDVVMNCSGMGARALCNDFQLVPIRGQVIKVRAPWVKNFSYGEYDTCVTPGLNGLCTLSGSRGFNSANEEICPYETAAIRERCEKLLPSLAKAETVRYAVGIRPHRGIVRVELDEILSQDKATVVHNYGHGGFGFCTAPGTAKFAVQLAKDKYQGSSKV